MNNSANDGCVAEEQRNSRITARRAGLRVYRVYVACLIVVMVAFITAVTAFSRLLTELHRCRQTRVAMAVSTQSWIEPGSAVKRYDPLTGGNLSFKVTTVPSGCGTTLPRR
jgi:hypothetical protein